MKRHKRPNWSDREQYKKRRRELVLLAGSHDKALRNKEFTVDYHDGSKPRTELWLESVLDHLQQYPSEGKLVYRIPRSLHGEWQNAQTCKRNRWGERI